jgi:16S rRNA processing protein RimM
MVVERSRAFKGGVLVKPLGVSGRGDDVEAMRGRSLLLPRAELEPLDENEVFVHQLVGLTVHAGDDVIGRVREVFESPGGHLLEVRRPDGRDLLVPFVAEMIGRVDVEAGSLEIVPPVGLLEL